MMTIVFYEAPLRIKKTLTVMLEILGDRIECSYSGLLWAGSQKGSQEPLGTVPVKLVWGSPVTLLVQVFRKAMEDPRGSSPN